MSQPPAEENLLDLYDEDLLKITDLHLRLQERFEKAHRNYSAVEREIADEFEKIGFRVAVNWHEYSVDGQRQEGAMPEVTITGRVTPLTEFDHDRQTHQVTKNILEIPGEGGVIKTDHDTFKNFMEGHGSAPGHSHRH